MPTIEYHDIPGSPPYLTVLVDKGETFPNTGLSLDYAAWIGTIDADGSVNTWTPAGGRLFKGYLRAAEMWLKTLASDPAVMARFSSEVSRG